MFTNIGFFLTGVSFGAFIVAFLTPKPKPVETENKNEADEIRRKVEEVITNINNMPNDSLRAKLEQLRRERFNQN